jgi:16S rRNA (uracil1498-N3)-methyltransferase
LVVVRCERSVKRSIDVQRCRRVAIEAARQSGRGDVPVVEGPLPFAAAVRDAAPGLRLLLHPDGEQPLGAFPLASDADVTLAVGPEGGFTPDELEAARGAGFALARLGRFVLRTETACAAALGALAAAGDDAGHTSS